MPQVSALLLPLQDWLLRAVAGKPDRIQIMYGIGGERRLTEFELAELSGYEASRPLRIGNAASGQRQLDVYGELLDSAYLARHKGLRQNEAGWEPGRALVNHLEQIWTEPDAGIWEIRGPQRHFVHSKVMAWLAFDRAVRMVQEFGVDGPLDRWVRLRSDIHDEVCSLGFSRELNSFVQYYGSKELDASLLLLPLVGFLPPEDHRIQGTVAAIEKNLMQDGLVARYDTRSSVDGLVVVREGAELHRHDVPAHHEGGAETRPETKEEHRSTLVAPKGLHRGIVDDLHGPTKRHFEIEPDPAMAKIAGFSESTIRTLRVVFIRIPAPLCHTGGTVDTVTFNSCRVRSSALKIS